MRTQLWEERNEGHMVIVQIDSGVVVGAALVGPDDDLEAICASGMPDGVNDPDLAEMIDATQDEFDFLAEVM